MKNSMKTSKNREKVTRKETFKIMWIFDIKFLFPLFSSFE